MEGKQRPGPIPLFAVSKRLIPKTDPTNKK